MCSPWKLENIWGLTASLFVVSKISQNQAQYLKVLENWDCFTLIKCLDNKYACSFSGCSEIKLFGFWFHPPVHVDRWVLGKKQKQIKTPLEVLKKSIWSPRFVCLNGKQMMPVHYWQACLELCWTLTVLCLSYAECWLCCVHKCEPTYLDFVTHAPPHYNHLQLNGHSILRSNQHPSYCTHTHTHTHTNLCTEF